MTPSLVRPTGLTGGHSGTEHKLDDMALGANLEKQSMQFNSHGGARPGAGRPRGTPNRITRPLKELAAEFSEDSIQTLVWLRDHAQNEQVRLNACRELLDRAHGKPRQGLDLTKDEGITVIIDKCCHPDHLQNSPVVIEHQADEMRGPAGT
jgi:hypothetical protein